MGLIDRGRLNTVIDGNYVIPYMEISSSCLHSSHLQSILI